MDRRTFLGAVGTSAGLSALGGLPSAGRAATTPTKLTLLVGTAPPDPACHYFYYAMEKGFYAKRGVEVEIKPIAAETTAVRGLLAGECDVAWVGAISTLQAINAGSKLRVLSCFTPKLDYLVVAADAVASLKDLAGKTVAVSAIGAVSHIVPELMIDQAGGDSKQTRWLSVGNSASRVQAVVAKRVDAAPLNSSFASRAMQSKGLHVIGDAVRDLPDFVYAWEIVSAGAVANKSEALQAFTLATAEGARWAMANPGEAAAISQKLLPDVPAAELTEALKGYASKRFFAPAGQLSRQAWDFTVASMLKLGTLKQTISYDDIVLKSFGDTAAKELGPMQL